jgi:hypothetical protein
MHKTEVRVLVYTGEPEWVDRAPDLSHIQGELKANRGCIVSTWIDQIEHEHACSGDHIVNEAGAIACLPDHYRVEVV